MSRNNMSGYNMIDPFNLRKVANAPAINFAGIDTSLNDAV
jgi:hypothetical protein